MKNWREDWTGNERIWNNKDKDNNSTFNFVMEPVYSSFLFDLMKTIEAVSLQIVSKQESLVCSNLFLHSDKAGVFPLCWGSKAWVHGWHLRGEGDWEWPRVPVFPPVLCPPGPGQPHRDAAQPRHRGRRVWCVQESALGQGGHRGHCHWAGSRWRGEIRKYELLQQYFIKCFLIFRSFLVQG